jgi:hypothetical protein
MDFGLTVNLNLIIIHHPVSTGLNYFLCQL